MDACTCRARDAGPSGRLLPDSDAIALPVSPRHAAATCYSPQRRSARKSARRDLGGDGAHRAVKTFETLAARPMLRRSIDVRERIGSIVRLRLPAQQATNHALGARDGAIAAVHEPVD